MKSDVVTYLRWGKKEIHPKYGTEHFLVVGASGSGKTTMINMMLKSVFDSPRSFRTMIYDPKQEVLPYLYTMMLGKDYSRIKVLDPFDKRSSAWNLAEDIDGPVSARQFATILIPDTKSNSGGESFFTNAARDLLTGVLLTFINCVPKEGTWTFRDVILAMLYEPYLRFLLEMSRTRTGESFPITSRLKETYLAGDPQKSDLRTTSNIRATINTTLSIYEPVAAVWHLAQKKGFTFSLSQWVKAGCCDVLVLGNDEASRSAIDAINRAIFKRATELMLASRETTRSQQEAGENQTWFFLDEVREAGELDGLSRLLTKGRSKGACIVLGFQDIDGMRDAYNDEVAHEICGQCNNIAVLKLNSPSTAKWASELFGSRLAASRSRSSGTTSDGGVQTSRESGEDERPWVYTSELLYLPMTSSQSGLHGYFRSPGVDPEKHSLVQAQFQSSKSFLYFSIRRCVLVRIADKGLFDRNRMQKKVTIFHVRDWRGVDYYWCCTKKHRYLKDSEAATRCCNGWTPVIVPRYYEYYTKEYWGRWYEPEATGSHRLLIPDFLTDEIARLRAVWGDEDKMRHSTWDWDQSNIDIEN